MRPGDLVAGRFEIERLAGTGGMGAVYRARDRETDATVALKVALGGSALAGERFLREAAVLAELRHPGIVRYVGHGREPDGALYLAMEWLDGMDLAARLGRQGLTVSESVVLVLRVATAIGVAHARGVIHRDLKPGNVFLPGGSIDRAMVLDFGVARLADDLAMMTRTGAVVGTPAYMAPEQARGERDVDARADVFALGSLLFECLTGRPPFFAENAMGALAKILLEEAPPVRERRPDVPVPLAELLAGMLAKDRELRPADGEAVARALAGIDAGPAARAPASAPQSALTEGEQRLLSVLFVGGSEVVEATARTAPASAEAAPDAEPVRAAVAPFRGHVERLAGGALVVSLFGAGAATDQAARAARCALAVRAARPEAPMALAMGRSATGTGSGATFSGSGRLPTGEVIDRGAGLLGKAAGGAGGGAAIRIDEVTAGLLDARFDVGGDPGGLVLRGEREEVDAPRTLLGRPTPCIGRERDLAALTGLLDECIAEPVARVALVTAAAGVGKSRLRGELVRAARERKVEVWMARGDPMSSGSPFGMLAGLVRRAAGVLEGEPLATRQQKLRARVGRRLAEGRAARVVELLGEIVGTRFPGGPELAAARRDARLMGDQMLGAWLDFLAAECAAQPVLLVLEDLHWGDLPSVKLLDAALRSLRDAPLMVLAIARPEVHDLFPRLWTERGVEEIRLSELSRGACRKLIGAVLGEGAPEATVELLIERAAGNAFYLEELLRAVAGRGDGAAGGTLDLPATVLAMVEARLQTMSPDVRRVLRAASVFGQVFWSDGVALLTGSTTRTLDLGDTLSELVGHELVKRRSEGRFPSTTEYAFRHALVREAAYATLTDGDRKLGHRLAGEWLERAGECDSLALAEHFERGGRPERAITWYQRAAEQALEGNDLAAALERAERGVRCGAAGEVLGRLRLLEAEASTWRGEYESSRTRAYEALALLPRGQPIGLEALARAASAEARLGNLPALEGFGRELLAMGPQGAAARAGTWAHVAAMLVLEGRLPLADELLAQADLALRPAGELVATRADTTEGMDYASLGALEHARAARAFAGKGGLGEVRPFLERAVEAFERAGDARNACSTRINAGFAYLEGGAYEEAEALLRRGLEAAERLGLRNVAASARQNLGLVLARLGQVDEGARVEASAVASFEASGDKRMEALARCYLAEILLLAAAPKDAERQARAAVAVAAGSRGAHAFALAILAQALLAQERPAEALDTASEAAGEAEVVGPSGEGDLLILLTHAEALHAAGDLPRARAAIAAARAHVTTRAAAIRSPEQRATFLIHVPEAARTLQLADAWGWAGSR